MTILGEKLFHIVFQEGVYLLYEQYSIGFFKVIEDKLLGQGPGGAQFEDANPLIHVQINYCVQTVHPPAATCDYQKLGLLWTAVQIKMGFLEQLARTPELFAKGLVVEQYR